MKTNCRAVRMLALVALLVLLGGARAGAAGGELGAEFDPHTLPEITSNAEFPPYGDDIVLHCSAKNATHLEMKEDSESLQIIEVNTTTVQFRVKKPNVGIYVYSCVDSETGCEDSVTVLVRPAMSVESLTVHYKEIYGIDHYFVPLGKDYEVLCSGHDSEALSIMANGLKLQTDVINRTCIKYRTRADRVEEKLYICIANYAANDVNNVWDYYVKVTIDYNPECHNLSCVLYDNFNVLECSWHLSTDQISYQLFYTDDFNYYGFTDMVLLCADKSGTATGVCRVTEKLMQREFFFYNHNISLLLMSCNDFICNNQSFAMNTAAISKADPVEYLYVIHTTSRGVTLEWRYDRISDYNYKIEYRQTTLDDHRRQGDALIRCEHDHRCECELALPYPGKEYEVWVYARHKAATDDRQWSKPESVRVTTSGVEQCACGAAPGAAAEPTTTISAETASCELCTLAEYTINEGLSLKKKIKSLKEKLANYNDYSRLLSKEKELATELKKYERD